MDSFLKIDETKKVGKTRISKEFINMHVKK